MKVSRVRVETACCQRIGVADCYRNSSILEAKFNLISFSNIGTDTDKITLQPLNLPNNFCVNVLVIPALLIYDYILRKEFFVSSFQIIFLLLFFSILLLNF